MKIFQNNPIFSKKLNVFCLILIFLIGLVSIKNETVSLIANISRLDSALSQTVGQKLANLPEKYSKVSAAISKSPVVFYNDMSLVADLYSSQFSEKMLPVGIYFTKIGASLISTGKSFAANPPIFIMNKIGALAVQENNLVDNKITVSLNKKYFAADVFISIEQNKLPSVSKISDNLFGKLDNIFNKYVYSLASFIK
jgi:hypothetical protein